MEANPLVPDILFHLGPVGISRSVVTTWVLMAALAALAAIAMRDARVRARPLQAVVEVLVDTIADQVRQIIGRDPWPFVPLLGTLFIFITAANLAAVVPAGSPPTGHIETPAALALIVFMSVHYHGIRMRGLRAYFKRYAEPSVFLFPLNILSELTRTFSLMVRLFGNMMSHEFVIAIVLFLAGLFLPIPFLLLGVLIGVIQAYIFTVLAAVYIGAAVGSIET